MQNQIEWANINVLSSKRLYPPPPPPLVIRLFQLICLSILSIYNMFV